MKKIEPKFGDGSIWPVPDPKTEDTFDPYDWEDDFGDYNEVLDKVASEIQVGGNHYTKLAIQPMTYSMANKLNALQHTALKYITRYQDKGTPLQDLAKARHCIDMMVEDWIDNHDELGEEV